MNRIMKVDILMNCEYLRMNDFIVILINYLPVPDEEITSGFLSDLNCFSKAQNVLFNHLCSLVCL